MAQIAVLGGGAWGTALALTAARGGNEVVLWARDNAVVSRINEKKRNDKYLPETEFDAEITASTDLAICQNAEIVLLVTPAQSTRQLLSELKPQIAPEVPVVLCAKGIEQSTGMLLSQIVTEVLPNVQPAVLSGPSFADDVAKGLPTAVTIAAEKPQAAEHLVETLATPAFRPYASTDILGTQIGGALKNVLAIACGAVAGKGLGASAQAALTARGFAELTRLGTRLGARPETLTGLSGLGDLVLTCSSSQSRNFSFGMALGQGKTAKDLIGEGGKLAEGAHSARIAVQLGHDHNVDLPICSTVARLVEGEMTIDDALASLMARPLKHETG